MYEQFIQFNVKILTWDILPPISELLPDILPSHIYLLQCVAQKYKFERNYS